MISVRARILGSFFRREGNIGYLAPYISQNAKAMRKNAPRRRGTRVCADFQEYWYPPQRRPAMNRIMPTMERKPPTKSMREMISRLVRPVEFTRGGGK